MTIMAEASMKSDTCRCQTLPGDQPNVAAKPGARHHILCLRARQLQDDLHHQFGGRAQSVAAQNHQTRGSFRDDGL